MIAFTIDSLHWGTKDVTEAGGPEDVIIGAGGGGILPQRVQWLAAGERYTVEPYYN